ncbi:hypothetical protein SDRG_12403 [Saprolegnia diclina VS20]|uniref:Uncharacterized protein n=1 Tax=Saprolegnia diclina (strain VS20) TaxID=1156394 RepID=T0Q5I0_SAPDV|nr:hypothetical protein SDRG_12403 [Saprolegnia diclina VS20]EQC29856.1 hypothetical protein SDRG_12403 [Saprolegnia diclina VS20]|eukprot:XP_008616695.1 hypothetical protein SDRG_12403 [Saprolegnia diclina VS20]
MDDERFAAAAEDLRRRNRVKQKRLRERVAAERRSLRAQVATLCKALAASAHKPNDTLLSWKTIAAGLARSTVESRLSSVMLRQELERTLALSGRIQAWVASMHPSRTLLPAAPFSWINITLVDDIASRKVGLDWYTQHLYFNTERMVALCNFPSHGAIMDNLILELGQDLVDLIGRIQIDYDQSLEATYALLRDTIWAELRGDTHSFVSEFLDQELTEAIDPTMLYRRTVLEVDESNYYVCREFCTDDRIVFLFGNFSQDARQPENHRWRPRLFWYILERHGPHRTRLKVIMYNGPKMIYGRLNTWRNVLESVNEYNPEKTDAQLFARYRELVDEQFYHLLRVDYASLTLQAGEIERSAVENVHRIK